MNDNAIQFKVATEPWEFELIHELNYQTFVEEIPQHQANGEKRLIDRFHDDNIYIIALKCKQLLGMLALRTQRPFSLDQKVPGLDRFLPTGVQAPCEVRLLATQKEVRNGLIFRGLINQLIQIGLQGGFDIALISGTLRQQKLYKHMGFVPFGPLVGSADAPYQPMYLTRKQAEELKHVFPAFKESERTDEELALFAKPYSFLPGPVSISPLVKQSLQGVNISHRDPVFLQQFQATRNLLKQLSRANNVQIMMGSGTLVNDIVAAHIGLRQEQGLILSNGAFGDRLIDHAHRHGLAFKSLIVPWGQRFDPKAIEQVLQQNQELRWLWAVHGETSSSVLNDLQMLKEQCLPHGIALYLDAVSTLGTVPVDLQNVTMASSVSGKGLASQAGLGLIFHADLPPRLSHKLPRYFDMSYYDSNQGVPFTINTLWVHALHTALRSACFPIRYLQVRQWALRMRQHLQKAAIEWIGDQAAAFPAILTLQPKGKRTAQEIGDALKDQNYLVSYQSKYLLERNWLQISFMGYHFTESIIDSLAASLIKLIND